jgi:transcriptional regulator GlxA family with amidase domain
MLPQIYILIQDQIAVSGIAGPVDVFNTANLLIENIAGQDAEKLHWKIVSPNGEAVSNTLGMELKADMTLNEIKQPGWLYIPGIMLESEQKIESYLNDRKQVISQLKQLKHKGINIAANCTSVFFLAEAGFLDGKQATITWWLADYFRQKYPTIDLHEEKVIVDAGDIICSGAATAYMELALLLVEKILGEKYAYLCSKYLLIDSGKKSQAAFKKLTPNSAQDPIIQAAKKYLLARLNQEIRIDDLANALAVSNRTLIRRFKKSTGDSPQQYIQKLRIERSKHLLESSSLSANKIMERVGYQNDSTFRRLFKRYTSLTPTQYRQKFSSKEH